jgi:hypothetical protein
MREGDPVRDNAESGMIDKALDSVGRGLEELISPCPVPPTPWNSPHADAIIFLQRGANKGNVMRQRG